MKHTTKFTNDNPRIFTVAVTDPDARNVEVFTRHGAKEIEGGLALSGTRAQVTPLADELHILLPFVS